MERRNTDVGSLEAALEQAPEVFEPVGMSLAIYLFNGMVNDLMEELTVKPVIGCQRIGVQGSASLDMTLYQSLKRSLPAVGYYRCLDLATALQESHDRRLVFATRASNFFVALRFVHVPRFPTDEGLINFDLTPELHKRAALHGLADAVQHEPC
jgi:hypothetical protein